MSEIVKHFCLFVTVLKSVSSDLPKKFVFRVLLGCLGSLLELVTIFSLLLATKIYFQVDVELENEINFFLIDKINLEFSLYIALTFIVASICVRAFVLYTNITFGHFAGNLTFKKLTHVLNSPQMYHRFLEDFEDVKATLLLKVDQVSSTVYFSFVQLVSGVIQILFMILALVVVDPVIVSYAMLTLICYYLVWSWIVSPGIDLRSDKLAEYLPYLVSTIDEGFRSFKDLHVFGRFLSWQEVSVKYDLKIRKFKIINTFLAGLPRLGLELLILVSIICAAIFIGNDTEEIISAAPKVIIFIFTSQRLMPAVQQVYSSYLTIRGNYRLLKDIDYLIREYPIMVNHLGASAKKEDDSNLDDLVLKNIKFKYPKLLGLKVAGNFTFNRGKFYALVGSSGIGKTTLLNLIMGFLPVESGKISLGASTLKNPIDANWMSRISFVSQSVFLQEGSLLYNITGENQADVDIFRLNKIIEGCGLQSLVTKHSLEYKIEKSVDGVGVGLSGGERQRIGIARCLYKDADIYIIDEPTASLDKQTSEHIFRMVKEFLCDKILIVSSHDETIMKFADELIELDKLFDLNSNQLSLKSR